MKRKEITDQANVLYNVDKCLCIEYSCAYIWKKWYEITNWYLILQWKSYKITMVQML